jgi:hypothetical protein
MRASSTAILSSCQRLLYTTLKAFQLQLFYEAILKLLFT